MIGPLHPVICAQATANGITGLSGGPHMLYSNCPGIRSKYNSVFGFVWGYVVSKVVQHTVDAGVVSVSEVVHSEAG